MSEANKRTIEAYDNGVQGYIDGTGVESRDDQKEWLGSVFTLISKDASILEIGSASGRDARYLTQLGYKVDVTDATPGFVDYMNQNGYAASKLDIVDEVPAMHYDMVLALAVFLHFTDEDLNKALGHVCECLNDGGIFTFTLKRGMGEEWGNTKLGGERYYNYKEREDVEKMLDAAGLTIVDDLSHEDDAWLYIVARKQKESEFTKESQRGKRMAENIIAKGKIFELVQTEQPDGRVFELARRAPGVRIIIADKANRKLLLTKEFRQELNDWDYRLPGGKVYDTLDEYEAARRSGEDMLAAVKRKTIAEAAEEAGIEVHDAELFKKSTLGATVEWDLYVMEAQDWRKSDSGQALEQGEQIIAEEWFDFEQAEQMIYEGKMQEERVALILLQWLKVQQQV